MVKSFFDNILGKLKTATSDSSEKLNKEETESLKNILSELDHLPVDQARYLASFAYILFRVAYADSQISDEESQAIVGILQKWGELSESQALLVAQIAKSQNLLFGGTDNFLVTREFKDMTTADQKLHLIECLFAVAASDDTITGLESDTIRNISRELGLSHEQFISARQPFAKQLAALK